MTNTAIDAPDAGRQVLRPLGVATDERSGRESPWTRRMRRVFSFPSLLAVGLVVVALMTISDRFNDPDLWFHLKLGKIVWDTHSIPSTDLLSYTAFGHNWTAHEWLAEVGLYAVYRMGGHAGLMLWFATLSSLLPVLVFYLCYRLSGNALVSFFGGLCAWFFGTVGLAIRPHLLGHIFLVIELILLERGSRSPRVLLALPPLFAIWVNCHGSYFFGMGVLVVHFLCSFASGRWGQLVVEPSERRSRQSLGVTLVLCALALCCNPIGIRLLLYPLDTLFHQRTGLNAVDEWLPPDLRSGRTLAMIGLVIGVSWLRRSELHLKELLVMAMGFGLALQHSRMLFLFGIVASPILCRVLAPMLTTNHKRQHPILNGALMLASLTAATAVFPSSASLDAQVSRGNPVGAVEYVRRAGLSGPMLNEYVFGGYLTWALPEQKVFIDGRGDVYDWTGVFAEYGRWATLSEDPALLLDKYRVQFCLLSKDSVPARVMPYIGWKPVFSDHMATVFVRNER
jgi:hypothetical protein